MHPFSFLLVLLSLSPSQSLALNAHENMPLLLVHMQTHNRQANAASGSSPSSSSLSTTAPKMTRRPIPLPPHLAEIVLPTTTTSPNGPAPRAPTLCSNGKDQGKSILHTCDTAAQQTCIPDPRTLGCSLIPDGCPGVCVQLDGPVCAGFAGSTCPKEKDGAMVFCADDPRDQCNSSTQGDVEGVDCEGVCVRIDGNRWGKRKPRLTS